MLSNLHHALHEEQGGLCHYCKREMILTDNQEVRLRITIDHKTARSRGGSNARENIVGACHECNGFKGFLSDAAFFHLMEITGKDRGKLSKLCKIEMYPGRKAVVRFPPPRPLENCSPQVRAIIDRAILNEKIADAGRTVIPGNYWNMKMEQRTRFMRAARRAVGLPEEIPAAVAQEVEARS